MFYRCNRTQYLKQCRDAHILRVWQDVIVTEVKQWTDFLQVWQDMIVTAVKQWTDILQVQQEMSYSNKVTKRCSMGAAGSDGYSSEAMDRCCWGVAQSNCFTAAMRFCGWISSTEPGCGQDGEVLVCRTWSNDVGWHPIGYLSLWRSVTSLQCDVWENKLASVSWESMIQIHLGDLIS